MNNEIRDTAEAIKGIAEALPVYPDALQPAVKEIGKTLCGTVRIALSPLNGLIWGYGRIESWLSESVSKKLGERGVTKENVVTPDPSIAVPIVESIRITGNKPELQEMYANLLTTAMNPLTTNDALAAFVEIVKQLTPDESKLLNHLRTNENLFPFLEVQAITPNQEGYVRHTRFVLSPEAISLLTNKGLVCSYIDNLQRLGLLNATSERQIVDKSHYRPIQNSDLIQTIEKQVAEIGKTVLIKQGIIELTDLGEHFMKVCLPESEA